MKFFEFLMWLIKDIWQFHKAMFSEKDGTPSAARMLSTIAMLYGCHWVNVLVYHNWVLPDFSGLSLFIGVPYGINKITGTIESIGINKNVNINTTHQ
jgi:hypothetical protein